LKRDPTTPAWQRIIAHADMDAFYAAIEQLDDSRLRGRPILVGSESRRGVVLTASYEARPYGVGSAMPMHEARRRCPQALVVPPRFARYQEVSASVMRVFGRFSPAVEPLSLDEAFLDMTGSERLLGTPEQIGNKLKEAVREATGGLTASVGVSGTKYVAKVASGYRKPDGLTIVPQHAACEWLAPLPVDALWGAGKKTAARLRALGLETIGDVAAYDSDALAAQLGRAGQRFAALARAEDPRDVESGRPAQSIGSERTLEHDVSAYADIEASLREEADTVARRLRRNELTARGVRVKLKRSDFRILTRQCRLDAPSDVSAELFAAAARLVRTFDDPGPFRLIGIAAFDLLGRAEAGGAEPPQLDLGESN
jgi:DNA polymerase-4